MAAFLPGAVLDGSTVEAALHAKSTQLVTATATQIGHEHCKPCYTLVFTSPARAQ